MARYHSFQGLDFGKGFASRSHNACLARAGLDARYDGRFGVYLRPTSAELDQSSHDGNGCSVGKHRVVSSRFIIELSGSISLV
jgi:hypothetical protein